MDNGLFLSVEEFNELPNKAKLTCLYENQVRQFTVMGVQKKDYTKVRFNQRIQYFGLTGLLAGLVFTFKFFAGRL